MANTFPTNLSSLSKIRTDGDTQPRVSLNQDVVDEYAEAMKEGAKFPAVTVFYDQIDYWLADGFHRLSATQKAGQDKIEATVRLGSLLDAQWYSFEVNKAHGLRRTNEDKRKAVEAALEHEQGQGLSSGGIAKHCGVSDMLVLSIKKQLAE